jgi:peroxiredoxin
VAALEPGARFPRITLRDESGAAADPKRGGETLYAVFKTTCPTCELTWPFLERIRKIAEGGPFSIVAVTQDDPAKTRAFAERLDTRLDTLYDREPWPASDALGLTTVPTLFRVGADGVIAETFAGFDRARLQALAGRAAALAGKPAPELFRASDHAPPFKPG